MAVQLVFRWVSAFVLSLFVLVATPGVASAHASLVSTSPSNGSSEAVGPSRVLLDFNGGVSASPGGVRVFDSQARRVDDGRVSSVPGDDSRVVAELPGPLPDGGYVVTWRVVSADSHPIHGAFTFTVGTATASDPGLVDRLLTEDGGDRGTGIAFAIARVVMFAGLLLATGFVAFVALVDRRSVHRRMGTVFVGIAAAGTAASILLQGPYGAALGVGSVFDASLLADTLDTRYGAMGALRLLLLAALIAVLVAMRRHNWRGLAGAAALLTAGLAATISLSGHAISGPVPGLAVPADVLHLVAAGAWAGGVVVALFVVRDAAAARRFSRLATWCVGVVIATGAFQTWRQVGNLDALTSTDYGRILLVKLAAAALVVAVAWFAHRLVHKNLDEPQAAIGRLRRFLVAEAALAVVVVVATSLLVNAVPARSVDDGPRTATIEIPQGYVEVLLSPAETGPNELHVYTLGRDGQITGMGEVEAKLALPSAGIDDLELRFVELAKGHVVTRGLQVPIAGEWRLDVSVFAPGEPKSEASTVLSIR